MFWFFFNFILRQFRRSEWPRGLRRRSAAARLLRSWVRIPPVAWMFVCCECCVLSGRGLCDELITRPEESYRLWCVAVFDLGTPRIRRPWPALGRSATRKNKLRQFHPIHKRVSEPFSALDLKLKIVRQENGTSIPYSSFDTHCSETFISWYLDYNFLLNSNICL